MKHEEQEIVQRTVEEIRTYADFFCEHCKENCAHCRCNGHVLDRAETAVMEWVTAGVRATWPEIV